MLPEETAKFEHWVHSIFFHTLHVVLKKRIAIPRYDSSKSSHQ
jgi:hypothetical protein